MKKIFYIFLLLFAVFIFFIAKSNIISDPKPEECASQTVQIVEIYEGSSHDIVFRDGSGDLYYINRGLERGLNLDSLNNQILNKSVTLQLPKLFWGTSEHIAQIQLGDQIIFTEFN